MFFHVYLLQYYYFFDVLSFTMFLINYIVISKKTTQGVDNGKI